MKSEKQLYQWDVNQYLTGINPAAQYVDYTIGNEVIRLETDGARCRIPDEVLQTYGGKTCYERYPDGTFRAYSFSVLYAPKPPEYVYTPEEHTTFEALTARVDAAIEEINRRADSGEFTPKKGVDYFTEAEKNELMEGVSSGAVGEFQKVVDSATTEYDDNHNSKLAEYNANASEKLTTYDTNAEQHTTDYNRNAAEKLESYNQNHAAKVAEYNQNAETKTAEFDSNAAALQTEVDRLRGECDTLAAENRKQENRIDALIKLNKGQTYDILSEDGESASRTAPSGAKYVGIDKVGGKSVVWNQMASVLPNATENGLAYSTDNGKISITGTVQGAPKYGQFSLVKDIKFKRDGRKYLILLSQTLNVGVSGYDHASRNAFFFSTTAETDLRGYIFLYVEEGETVNVSNLIVNIFDITQMFGSTIADYIYSIEKANAGAGVAWFKQMFPADYYHYSEPTIISSQTDRVDVASSDGTVTQQITTSFPVLNSAGSVYDYIGMDGGQVIRNVYTVEIETLQWRKNADNRFVANLPAKAKAAGTFNDKNNELCNTYESKTMNEIFAREKGIVTHPITGETVWIFDSAYETPEQLVASLAGAVLHYELATPTTEQVSIPEDLQEWLPVEAGGTVTFRNADDSKQLAVPNAVSWVRKLDEVN